MNETITVQVEVNVYHYGAKKEESGSLDSYTLSALILYILGFFGMGVMLTSVPSQFLLVGIVASVLYVLPLLAVLLALVMKPKVEKRREFGIISLDPVGEPLTYFLVNLLIAGKNPIIDCRS